MRIVSLVPSLTETLFALGLSSSEIVGRTAWCVHPAEAVGGVRVVGGTKTPSLRSVLELEPDLVILEREENTKEFFEACRAADLATVVTHVLRVEDVPSALRELGEACGRSERAEELALECEHALAEVRAEVATALPGPMVLPLIWNDPLMAVSASRYSGDLLVEAGFRLPPLPDGYPTVDAQKIAGLDVDALLLTSEPHEFTAPEGQAICQAVEMAGGRPLPFRLVDGEALTWFGARTASALGYWRRLRRELTTTENLPR